MNVHIFFFSVLKTIMHDTLCFIVFFSQFHNKEVVFTVDNFAWTPNDDNFAWAPNEEVSRTVVNFYSDSVHPLYFLT